MLRMTLNKIKKVWAIALASRGKIDAGLGPGKHLKLLATQLLKADKSTEAGKNYKQKCKMCQEIIDSLFGTSSNTLKYIDIKENPQQSLCINDSPQMLNNNVLHITKDDNNSSGTNNITDKGNDLHASTDNEQEVKLQQKVEVINEQPLVESETEQKDTMQTKYIQETDLQTLNNEINIDNNEASANRSINTFSNNLENKETENQVLNEQLPVELETNEVKTSVAIPSVLNVSLDGDLFQSKAQNESMINYSNQNKKSQGTPDTDTQHSLETITKQYEDTPNEIKRRLIKDIKKLGIPHTTDKEIFPVKMGVINKRKPIKKTDIDLEVRKLQLDQITSFNKELVLGCNTITALGFDPNDEPICTYRNKKLLDNKDMSYSESAPYIPLIELKTILNHLRDLLNDVEVQETNYEEENIKQKEAAYVETAKTKNDDLIILEVYIPPQKYSASQSDDKPSNQDFYSQERLVRLDYPIMKENENFLYNLSKDGIKKEPDNVILASTKVSKTLPNVASHPPYSQRQYFNEQARTHYSSIPNSKSISTFEPDSINKYDYLNHSESFSKTKMIIEPLQSKIYDELFMPSFEVQDGDEVTEIKTSKTDLENMHTSTAKQHLEKQESFNNQNNNSFIHKATEIRKCSPLQKYAKAANDSENVVPNKNTCISRSFENSNLTLSEMLRRVRTRSPEELHQVRNCQMSCEQRVLVVNPKPDKRDPIGRKCGGPKRPPCPPPAPKCPGPPASSPPPPAPCPRPCDSQCPYARQPTSPTCPPPTPTCPPNRARYAGNQDSTVDTIFMNILETLVTQLPSLSTFLPKNSSTQTSLEKGKHTEIKEPNLPQSDGSTLSKHSNLKCVEHSWEFEELDFARTFDPWVPIPSWPTWPPKKQVRPPLICPKDGCKTRPHPPMDPCAERGGQPCISFPKRTRFSLCDLSAYNLFKNNFDFNMI